MSDENSGEPDATLRFSDLSGVENAVEMLRASSDPVERARLEVWFGDERVDAESAPSDADARGPRAVKVEPDASRGDDSDDGEATTSAPDGDDETLGDPPYAVRRGGEWVCLECGDAFDAERSVRGHQSSHADESGTEYPWLNAGNDPDEDAAKLRELRAGTAEHEVLTILADAVECGAETGLTVRELKNRMVDANPSNLSSAGVGLYRAMLVERRKTTRDRKTGWHYEYRPTAHGVAELERVGEYDPEERHRVRREMDFAVEHGSGRHEVLTAIYVATHDDEEKRVTTPELEGMVEQIAPQSVGPSCYELTSAGYVERVPVPKRNGHGSMYAYRLTDEGRERLEAIGGHPAQNPNGDATDAGN